MKIIPSIKKTAFTLIEILIAISLFMFILFAVYATWTSIVRGSQVGLKAASASQRSRIAIHTIENALLTAQMFGENARYYSFIADTTDQNYNYLSLTCRLPGNFPGSGLYGDNVVRRVTFEIQPGEDRENNLVMTQIPLLIETNDAVQPYPILLAKDVKWFVLEFWDTNQMEWATEFIPTNQLPKMMRVTLGVGHSAQHPNDPSEVITRTVALPSTIVAADGQLPVIAPGNPQP